MTTIFLTQPAISHLMLPNFWKWNILVQ